MRCRRSGCAAALSFYTLLSTGALLAAEANLPVASQSPERLVQAALESEIDGPSEVRGELLKQALALDPNYAPARWQSGFVRWDSQWLTPDEVSKRATRDPLVAEYRKRREAMVDTADEHRALARWCHKNKLVAEERVHWVKVLEFEANDEGALEALGLRWYEGRPLTRTQFEDAKQAAAEQRRTTQHWQPQIVKWRQAIDKGTEGQRAAAIEELAKVSDERALPALETVFAVQGDTKKALELNQLLLATAARIPGLAATHLLLRFAVLPDSPEVRHASAAALRTRPPHSFMPMILATMPGEFDTRCLYCILDDGTVIQDNRLLVKDGASYRFYRFWDADAPADVRVRTMNGGFLALARVYANEQSRAVFADQFEKQRLQFKERLESLLCEVAPFKKPEGASSWEQLWDNYCEAYYSPTLATPLSDPRCYVYMQTRVTQSCFAAGTPVVTASGSTPIEKIRIGDRVLAKNPQSGELAFKTVQRVTLRPASPILKIRTAGESLSATRGHPFWVNGKGWLMAKQLQVGDVLHALNGAVVIDALTEAPAQEAYNLIVSDFNSYFVGDQQLLVRDNSPLLEVAGRVPGLLADGGQPGR